jgi:hypothetical protein
MVQRNLTHRGNHRRLNRSLSLSKPKRRIRLCFIGFSLGASCFVVVTLIAQGREEVSKAATI